MIWILIGIIHGLSVIGNILYSYKREEFTSDSMLYAFIPVISQGLLIYRIFYK